MLGPLLALGAGKILLDAATKIAVELLARHKTAQGIEEERKKTKESRDKDFADDYRAMTGSFGDNTAGSPVAACTQKPDKAARRAQRIDKINKAKERAKGMKEGDPAKAPLLAAAENLEKNNTEVEYARAAKHVYLKNGDLEAMPPELREIAKTAPEGMLPVTDETELLDATGLSPSDLEPSGSNFKAAVYKLDPKVWGPENEGKYVVAFRGTINNNLEDWRNNIAQGVNEESEYYKRAVMMGEKISANGNGANVHLVGHSLGGGLASAASGGGGGLKASTFNSAGLQKNTVSRYTGNSDAFTNPADIAATRINGEALTKSQESGLLGMAMPDAVGANKQTLSPADPDTTLSEDELSLKLHGMDEVIFAIEKQKKADEAVLDSN